MIFFIEKNSHQHQDPATSWKNQVVNIILIKTSKEKHRQKHQDPGKSWKNILSILLKLDVWKEKSGHQY